MNTRLTSLIATASAFVLCAFPLRTSAQGTVVFDQQSSSDETPPNFGAGPTLQSQLPSAGQSFIPTLSGVDFVRLKFDDPDLSDGMGATVYVSLRSGSITGPILDMSAPVEMANGFSGPVSFSFSTHPIVSPGTTFYFELALAAGGPWNVDLSSYNYTRGTAFKQGVAYPGGDYWFREGIIVPEPSSATLLMVGTLWLLLRRAAK